jgi:alpha-glucosidase (family GH31 glycosyl hydrolase)
MYYNEDGNSEVARTVFIPDGTWIDVWSGEPFVDPQTITAEHNLSTLLIFVREGSVVALAENMSHTGES